MSACVLVVVVWRLAVCICICLESSLGRSYVGSDEFYDVPCCDGSDSLKVAG